MHANLRVGGGFGGLSGKVYIPDKFCFFPIRKTYKGDGIQVWLKKPTYFKDGHIIINTKQLFQLLFQAPIL